MCNSLHSAAFYDHNMFWFLFTLIFLTDQGEEEVEEGIQKVGDATKRPQINQFSWRESSARKMRVNSQEHVVVLKCGKNNNELHISAVSNHSGEGTLSASA